MHKEINVKIECPTDYSVGGEVQKFDSVIIMAPKPRQRSIYYKTAAKISSSFRKNSSSVDAEAKEAVSRAEIDTQDPIDGMMMMLPMMVNDYEVVAENVRKILADGCSKIDDTAQTRVTEAILNNLEMDDHDRLIAAYVAYFLLPRDMRPKQ